MATAEPAEDDDGVIVGPGFGGSVAVNGREQPMTGTVAS